MGGRSGDTKKKNESYTFTGGARKITYEEEKGNVKIKRTRFEYGKTKKKKNK